jgi:hypothetical protein
MDLGPGGNGYTVASGTSTSVTISLQAIVASIVPGGLYNSSISTATGASASGPSFGNPAFVVGAQTNNSTQEVNVCWSDNNGIAFPSESCTGAQNEDASGVTIQQSTSTCSNLQNDFASAFQLAPATVGGNVNDLTKGVATIQFESCANASAGNNVFVNVALGAGAPQSNPNYEVVDKPAADIFWNYTGGGGAGDESTTAPFWAAATSTTTGFPSGATVPVGITSPVQAATNPQPMTGATTAAKAVTYILAPLYAVVQDAAAIGGAQRESAGTNAVTLNLNGPDGFTAKLWAAQAAVPSNQSATGYQVIQPGSCAGVFTLGTRTTGKWGAMWPVNGGGTAASGTTCQVLVYDNDQPTNHYVVVTITNTLGSGGISFVPPSTAVQTVTISSVSLAANSPSTQTLSIVYKDSGGHTIVGPFTFPVTITDDDSSGATSLNVNGGAFGSSVQTNSPSDTVQLKYSGLAIGPFHLIPSGTGVTGTTLTVTPTNNPIVLGGLTTDTIDNTKPSYNQPALIFNQASGSQNFTATESGWSNSPYNNAFTATPQTTGTNQTGNCTSVATIGTGNLSAGTETWAVTAIGAGFCKITVTDGVGQSSAFWVSVTGNSFNVSSVIRR